MIMSLMSFVSVNRFLSCMSGSRLCLLLGLYIYTYTHNRHNRQLERNRRAREMSLQ
jgi:hypothetical protein